MTHSAALRGRRPIRPARPVPYPLTPLLLTNGVR